MFDIHLLVVSNRCKCFLGLYVLVQYTLRCIESSPYK